MNLFGRHVRNICMFDDALTYVKFQGTRDGNRSCWMFEFILYLGDLVGLYCPEGRLLHTEPWTESAGRMSQCGKDGVEVKLHRQREKIS